MVCLVLDVLGGFFFLLLFLLGFFLLVFLLFFVGFVGFFWVGGSLFSVLGGFLTVKFNRRNKSINYMPQE